MKKPSQTEKIIDLLEKHPNKKFIARDIAGKLIELYPDEYLKKKKNSGFNTNKELISQVVAEIGSQKNNLVKQNAHIFWQDKPRPRVFWFDPEKKSTDPVVELDENDEDLEIKNNNEKDHSEHELYPILIEYLKSELGLYCQRINEKSSKNSRGNGGNHWLHPDIVAMQPIDEKWNDLVQSCIKQGLGQKVRLWSFEVKKELTGANLRKSFFQAVSNSTWANEGYLVTGKLASSVQESELRMLSSLHGIGIILLNEMNPTESEILLPAKSREEVDWQSVNRIVIENKDFHNYIELVSIYLKTNIIRKSEWNKIIK